MAVHLNYDTDKRVIYVITAPTNGVVTLNAKVDIYSDMKEDWKTSAALNKLLFPLFLPVGGNLINPTKKISPYYFLKYGWRMRPYEADHTLYIEDGYLLVDGGGDPWIKTIGGYTVNVRDSVPADSFTEIVITGSGMSQEEHDKLFSLDTSNLDVLVSTRLATASYVAPDNQGITDIETKIDIIQPLIDEIQKLTGNKVTRAGDIITIYLPNGTTVWRQYDVANGGRVVIP